MWNAPLGARRRLQLPVLTRSERANGAHPTTECRIFPCCAPRAFACGGLAHKRRLATAASVAGLLEAPGLRDHGGFRLLVDPGSARLPRGSPLLGLASRFNLLVLLCGIPALAFLLGLATLLFLFSQKRLFTLLLGLPHQLPLGLAASKSLFALFILALKRIHVRRSLACRLLGRAHAGSSAVLDGHGLPRGVKIGSKQRNDESAGHCQHCESADPCPSHAFDPSGNADCEGNAQVLC